MDSKKEAEVIWAKNKYFVLSKSHNIYLEIREYLKCEDISLSKLNELINISLDLKEDKKAVINAYEHIWGYFKNVCIGKEKEEFFDLSNRYNFGEIKKEKVLDYLKFLLEKYPNTYLENSNIFNR